MVTASHSRTTFSRLLYFCVPLPPDSRPPLYCPRRQVNRRLKTIHQGNDIKKKKSYTIVNMKDKKSHVIAVIDPYERREILHDCGHFKDMKKKSYTTVIIHNHERREILRDCG